MEINWKDFGAMLLIGFALMFANGVVSIAGDMLASMPGGTHPFQDFGLNFIMIIFVVGISTTFFIPCLFYFWRNACNLKTAAAVSFAYGFVVMPFFLVSMMLLGLVMGLIFSRPLPYYYGGLSINSLLGVLIGFGIFGAMGLVGGLMAKVAVKILKR